MTKGFDDFKLKCELIQEIVQATGFPCITEFNDYEENGWFVCHFKVDKFGGNAACVKFIACHNEWIFSDYKNESLRSSLADAMVDVIVAIIRMANIRKNSGIHNLINAENED